MKKLDSRQEGILSILAALLVLFSAMLNPLISVGLSILLLITFSICKFIKK